MNHDDEDPVPEPILVIAGDKRGRGRPAIGPQVSTALPERYVEKLFRLAHDRGVSVAELARRILVYNLKRL